MNTELIVIWDGSHRNVDADLLCAQPLLQKRRLEPERPLEPLVQRVGRHDERYRQVVAILADGDWLTVRHLAAAAESTHDQIYVVIQRLTRQNRIDKRVIVKADRGQGQGWMEYRLKDVPASQVRVP